MENDQEYYEVWRSRNKGQFWSTITYGVNLGIDEAERIFEEEKKKHPSDWLKVVRFELSTVCQHLGIRGKELHTNDKAIQN